MSLPLSMRTSLGPALLLPCFLLAAPVGAQDTDSDDQQPQSQSQADTQVDQSSTDEANEQLPPQPSDTQSPDQPSQEQQQNDQDRQQYDQGQQQYDQGQSQYDRQAQQRRQTNQQRQQQFDRQREQFDRQTGQFSQDREFQGDRDATQRQWDDQSQQFDQRQFDDQGRRQDPGFARDRAFDDGRFEERQFQQQTTLRSTEDLGLRINERDNGLAVMDIDRSSVLIDSGLRPGDVLISVRNQPLRRSVDLVRWVRTLEPGARVPVQIMRDGRRETIYITGIDFNRWESDRWAESSGGAYLGVVFDDRYPSMALVEVVRPNTAADRAGLRPGDAIRRINGRAVNGLRHATALINQMQPGDEVELEFSRRTRGQAVARLGSRPDARQTTYYEGDDLPAYDGDAEIYQDRVTGYSEEIRTYEDDTPRRVRPLQDDDERFGERLRERAPVRRGLLRPFRNQ